MRTRISETLDIALLADGVPPNVVMDDQWWQQNYAGCRSASASGSSFERGLRSPAGERQPGAHMRARHVLAFLGPVGLLMALGFVVQLGQIFYSSVDGAQFAARSYVELARSTLFWRILENTFEISIESMLASLVLAYPVAYHLSRVPPRRRAAYTVLVLLPFWTSILVKSFAFTVILGDSGIVNNLMRLLFGDDAACRFCSTGSGSSSA